MRLPVLTVAALGLAALVIPALGSCDYLLQGTYTGLCDEPRSLFADLGEPDEVRRAQCQVEGNLCCRKRDPSSKGLSTDKRTYCLYAWDCYLGQPGEPCYGDIDCESGLTCEGGSIKANQQGQCQCPNAGVACRDMRGAIYCCAEGSVCGQASCVAPAPPDMSSLDQPDLRRLPDLKKTPEGGV